MHKKLIAVASCIALTLACVLGGCSSGSNASSTSSSDNSSDSTTSTEDTVVVYTTHPEKMLEALSDDFTKQTGIDVQFINLKGELADRVRSEKDNPQADVMYGGDITVYMQLAKDGCFEKSNPSWAADLPAEYKSADNEWFATIKTPVMMFYNTDKLSAENAPKDWSDLTDSQYKDQIVARDYISSSMRAAVCNLEYFFDQQDGEGAGQQFLSGLDANVKNYYNSGSMMFKAIGNGEAEIGISTMNDIIDNRDNNGMPLEYINAASGDVVVCDCVAAIKNAPHSSAAEKFLEYVGDKQTELMLAEKFNRMPALPDALTEAPEWMKADIKALPADWSVIAENQTAWLDTWQNQIYSQDKTVASNS